MSLLGLDFEREAGYQLIIKCICFCHLVFQVNSVIFLFLLDLLLCENKCCGVGDTIIKISRCDVATVRANQRIHKITVTGFVQRFVFVCLKSVTLLSSRWILVFYFLTSG